MGRRRVYGNRKQLTVLLPDEMPDALANAAYARGISRNLLVTKVLDAWLAAYGPAARDKALAFVREFIAAG